MAIQSASDARSAVHGPVKFARGLSIDAVSDRCSRTAIDAALHRLTPTCPQRLTSGFSPAATRWLPRERPRTSTWRYASDLLNGLGLAGASVDATLASRIAERLTTLAAIDDRPALRTALQALVSQGFVFVGRDVRDVQEIVRAVRPLRDHDDRELAIDALHAAVYLPLAEPDVTDIGPLGAVLRDRARKGFSEAAGHQHSVSWAIRVLGDVAWLDDERGAAAARHLTAFVESASDEYVRNAAFDDPAVAIHMVGRSHDPVALDVCLRLLTIPASDAIRGAALAATGRLGGPAVVSRLIPVSRRTCPER